MLFYECSTHLSPISGVLTEQLIVAHLITKCSWFHETRKFIAMSTLARQLPLFGTKWIRSMCIHPVPLRSLFMLSHPNLELPSGVFLHVFRAIFCMGCCSLTWVLYTLSTFDRPNSRSKTCVAVYCTVLLIVLLAPDIVLNNLLSISFPLNVWEAVLIRTESNGKNVGLSLLIFRFLIVVGKTEQNASNHSPNSSFSSFPCEWNFGLLTTCPW